MSKLSKKLGRPPGARNKATESIRSALRLLINDNLEQLQKDIDALPPKDRVNALVSLISFVVPKLNSVDLNTNNVDAFKPVNIYFDDANK